MALLPIFGVLELWLTSWVQWYENWQLLCEIRRVLLFFMGVTDLVIFTCMGDLRLVLLVENDSRLLSGEVCFDATGSLCALVAGRLTWFWVSIGVGEKRCLFVIGGTLGVAL